MGPEGFTTVFFCAGVVLIIGEQYWRGDTPAWVAPGACAVAGLTIIASVVSILREKDKRSWFCMIALVCTGLMAGVGVWNGAQGVKDLSAGEDSACIVAAFLATIACVASILRRERWRAVCWQLLVVAVVVVFWMADQVIALVHRSAGGPG